MNEIVRMYCGRIWSGFILLLIAFLSLAAGVSLIAGPADLLVHISHLSRSTWLCLIMVYFLLASILPIDKIIGKIYPIFGALSLFMAVSVCCVMLYKSFAGEIHMMELTSNYIRNFHTIPRNNILIPMLFIVISCGAVSGFHATQSPIMARCLNNEKHVRHIFYGAMIAEGIIAIIWATAAMSYFGGIVRYNQIILHEGISPAIVVNMICKTWLGKIGAIVAILGVIACPITSGDTALRSLRMVVADYFKLDQKPIINRLVLAIPIFIFTYLLCRYDFPTIWKYFSLLNQLMACFMLWTITIYLIHEKKNYWVAAIPAAFLSFIVVCYFMVAPAKVGGLHLNNVLPNVGYYVGVIGSLAIGFYVILRTKRKCRLYKK